MADKSSQTIYAFRDFRLDPAGRRLTGPDGQLVTLRPRVFDTLCHLVRSAGRPVAKADLMEAVWPGAVVEENNLNQAISVLRQVLGDDHRDPTFIATITGRGYQFVAPVRIEAPSDPGQPAEPVASSRPQSSRITRAAVSLALLAAIIVVFAWLRPPQPEHLVLDLDAADLVTAFPGSHASPTLSPDGTLMAFSSDRSGMAQIWVMGLPDGVPRQLTRGPQPATSPSWSPIDDAILFQRTSPSGFQSVWITDALGSGRPRLLVENARSPRFSRDGRSFVFTRNRQEIYIGSLEGETRLLEGIPETPGFADAMPAMNARGDIAFVLADEGPVGNLWLYTPDDAAFRQLTRSAGPWPGVLAESPAWLPDGRSVIYSAMDGDVTNEHLWQTDTVSGQTKKLTSGAGGYGEPAVSRDGSKVVYSYARPLWRLVETSPETGEERVLHESRTPIVFPVVSADGNSVVFFGEHIWTLGIDDEKPVQVTFFEPGKATLPTWSRNADTIYYYHDRALHRLDPATGISEPVFEDFHWTSRNWLAVGDDRLAYNVPGEAQTIVRNLESDLEIALTERVLPTDWSRDGRALLGRRVPDSALMICRAPDFRCASIMDEGVPVTGAIPRWSADETRVFFRRARHDRPGYAEIWVVDRAGGSPERVAEIGPYQVQPPGMYFGVTRDDRIIWNQYDRRGLSEIWRSVRSRETRN